jgi:tetratricopeptide (TPR) repeat protein
VVEEFPFAGVFDQAVAKRELIDRHRTLDWEPYLTYARTSRDFARRDYAAVPPRCDSVLARSPNAALRACAEMRKIVAETQATGNFISGTRRLTALLDGLPDPRTMPNAERQLEQFRAMADAERRAADRPNDAAAQTALGALFLQLGLPARALGPLELAVKLAPEDAQARLYFGYACNAAGRAPEAVEAFRFYLERNPADTNALNQIGYALLAQGQAEEALPYFRRYAELAPEDPNAHDSLGEGLLNAGRLEDAAAEYETAVRLNPDFANSHFMLGEVSRRLGRTERAVAAYRRFLDLGPDGRQADEARTALEQLGAK